MGAGGAPGMSGPQGPGMGGGGAMPFGQAPGMMQRPPMPQPPMGGQGGPMPQPGQQPMTPPQMAQMGRNGDSVVAHLTLGRSRCRRKCRRLL